MHQLDTSKLNQDSPKQLEYTYIPIMDCTYKQLKDLITSQKTAIEEWLASYEEPENLPLYTSVDIRDAGFKTAVVDTNLFPAGFNNLCEQSKSAGVEKLQKTIKLRVPECKNILIIAEEHTRNKWYLENIHVLETMIKEAGYHTTVATFLGEQPEECDEADYIPLETQSNKTIKMYCLDNILKQVDSGERKIDLIILNNDLTSGIPRSLIDSNIPIYPSLHAGWHSRLKSHHFDCANALINCFAKNFDIDPWLLSCNHTTVRNVNINTEEDRKALAQAAQTLYDDIQAKYDEYNIQEKPFIFLKADSGTYGMGVLPIENPSDILALNRKQRNKLFKGKSGQVIQNFILQEGVPTINRVDHKIAEACIYQIANQFVGGFYRIHNAKNTRENLNSQGMTFKKMCNTPTTECPYQKDDLSLEDCGIASDTNMDIYHLLAKIAGLAAQREIKELEANTTLKTPEETSL